MPLSVTYQLLLLSSVSFSQWKW